MANSVGFSLFAFECSAIGEIPREDADIYIFQAFSISIMSCFRIWVVASAFIKERYSLVCLDIADFPKFDRFFIFINQPLSKGKIQIPIWLIETEPVVIFMRKYNEIFTFML
jgi:hypothetical protein